MYFKKPYLEKLVRLLDKSGRRNDAIGVMEAWKGSDDLRMLYIDILIGWKMYDEALEVMDLSKERGVFLEDYNQKTLDVLDMIGSHDKTIGVCKYRFRTVDRKLLFYDKLRELLSKEEWNQFIDDVIQNADTVFQVDYDDVEAQIYMDRKM